MILSFLHLVVNWQVFTFNCYFWPITMQLGQRQLTAFSNWSLVPVESTSACVIVLNIDVTVCFVLVNCSLVGHFSFPSWLLLGCMTESGLNVYAKSPCYVFCQVYKCCILQVSGGQNNA